MTTFIVTRSYNLTSLHIGTYEVQEVIIPENTSSGNFIINCTFLTGSQAKDVLLKYLMT